LRKLNPGKAFDKAGVEILVPNVANQIARKGGIGDGQQVGRHCNRRDGAGKVIAQYPATVGSEHDPLPIGDWTVTGHQTRSGVFLYPKLFWDADSSDTKAKIPPGPNNPVGLVWIGLSKEHYGIHGTPEPGAIGHSESHGCIRLTNWDALELAA